MFIKSIKVAIVIGIMISCTFTNISISAQSDIINGNVENPINTTKQMDDNTTEYYQDDKLISTTITQESFSGSIIEKNIDILTSVDTSINEFHNKQKKFNFPTNVQLNNIQNFISKKISPTNYINNSNDTDQKSINDFEAKYIKKMKNRNKNVGGSGEESTYGFDPGNQEIYFTELYYDDFEDYSISEYQEIETGDATVSPATAGSDTGMVFYTYDSGAGEGYDGRALVQTHDLHYVYNDDVFQNVNYKVSIEFKLLSTNNHWFFIFHNQQIQILIDQDDDLKYWDGVYSGAQTIKEDLSTSLWYRVDVLVKCDTENVDIDLFRLDTGSNIAHLEDKNLASSVNINHKLLFGDDEEGTVNYGEIFIKDVKMKGMPRNHRYFDSFDFGVWYDWKIAVSGSNTRVSTTTGDLEIIDYPNYNALAYSPPVDYDITKTYEVFTVFKITSSPYYPIWTRLIDNGRVIVFIKRISGFNKLCYYDGSEKCTSKTVSYDDWHILNIKYDQSDQKFDIAFDNVGNGYDPENRDVCSSCGQGFAPRFRMGSSGSDRGHVFFKSFNVREGSLLGSDGDTDGLSDSFESGNNILAFSDDVEQEWKANGWYLDDDWERGTPALGVIKGYGNTDYAFCTDCDSTYSNAKISDLISGKIYLSNREQDTNVVLEVYEYYNLEPGDVAEIFVCNNKDPEEAGFTCESNSLVTHTGYSGWSRNTYTITDTLLDTYSSTIRIKFSLNDDNDDSQYAGWVIDNIRIYAQTRTSGTFKTNSDDEGLNDGNEYRVYGTSPLQMDTDFDGLNDWEEINDNDLNAKSINNGPASPVIMDIFIEIDQLSGVGLNSDSKTQVKDSFASKNVRVHYLNSQSTLLFRTYIGYDTGAYNVVEDYWDSILTFPLNRYNQYHYFLMANWKSSAEKGKMGMAASGGPVIMWEQGITYFMATYCPLEDRDNFEAEILMHEIGHTLGYDHIQSTSGKSMYQMNWGVGCHDTYVDYNDFHWRTINIDADAP